jgi:initiation factor 1A
MPGKKKGKSKKKASSSIKRALEVKADGQEYAKVTKMLGNCRVSAVFPDGKITLVHIPGKFRNRCRITVGDVIIVCIRSFEVGKTDMAYKYTLDELRTLRSMDEIPPFFMERDALEERGSDDEIEWADDEVGPHHRPTGVAPQQVLSDISSDDEDESEDIDRKIDVDTI